MSKALPPGAPLARSAASRSPPTAEPQSESPDRSPPYRSPAPATLVAHQRLDLARLQQLLNLAPLRRRQRPMMRPRNLLARQIIDRPRQPLRHPPRIHEDQRRRPPPNNLQQPRMNRLPDRSPLRPLLRRPARLLLDLAQPRHILDRNLHLQLQHLPRTRIHHRHRPVPHARIRSHPPRFDAIIAGRTPSSTLRQSHPSVPHPLRLIAVKSGSTVTSPAMHPPPHPEIAPPPPAAAASHYNPIRCSRRPVSASSRSSDSAICAPRLLGTSA